MSVSNTQPTVTTTAATGGGAVPSGAQGNEAACRNDGHDNASSVGANDQPNVSVILHSPSLSPVAHLLFPSPESKGPTLVRANTKL